MKLIEKVKSKNKQIYKWLSNNNNLLSLLIALVSIFIAYKSFELADISLKYSVKQTEISSHSSDSLFRLQHSYAKALNDSIINELYKLRNITDIQLEINQNQLLELKNISKPKIVVNRFYFVEGAKFDSLQGYNSNFGFKALVTLKNFGSREAINLLYKSYLVDSESYRKTKPNEGCIINKLDADEEYNFSTEFNSSFKLHRNYYICFQLNYLDPVVGKNICNKYYYTYSEDGSELEGNITKSSPDVINKLEKLIE